MVVDTIRIQDREAADLFIPIKAGQDFESFWVLLALAKGIELDAARVRPNRRPPYHLADLDESDEAGEAMV